MARPLDPNIDRQLEELVALLRDFPDGAARAALERRYGEAHAPIHWRTLLRRLDRLIDSELVVAEGEGRGRVYRLARRPAPPVAPAAGGPADEPTDDDAKTVLTEEGYVPVTAEGAEVRAFVRRPLAERPPVGYETTFLERYEPGRTWYLSADLRSRLSEMGSTPDADRPAGTHARHICEHLIIDLSWSSSRLEGNTYSRLDTLELLKYGRQAGGKADAETQMILNHKSAIEMMVDQAEAIGFNRYTFLGLHAALSENLLRDRQDEGRLRTRLVGIGGSKFTPLAIPQKIEEHFDLILAKSDAIPDPLEQAFFLMVHLPYLQPFVDVDKRTSRIGANLPLIKANLCPLSFVDVPERAYVEGTLGVYELRRVELLRDVFTWAYERSCAQYNVVREAMGKPDPVRLAHRELLRQVVRDTVQHGVRPDAGALQRWAAEHGVPTDDVAGFVEIARAELLDLHEGLLHRYSLRPSEYERWMATVKS